MKRIVLIFISLCASVLSITAQVDSVEQQRSAYTKAKQFVKKGMPPVPDASSFLPEPPAEGDVMFVPDSCMYEWGKTLRGTLRGDTAVADAGYAIGYFLSRFSPAVKQDLTEKSHPQLTQLLLASMNAGNKSIRKAKKKFARRRPYQYFKEGTPTPVSAVSCCPSFEACPDPREEEPRTNTIFFFISLLSRKPNRSK